MMEWLTPLLSAVVPSLVCGIVLAMFNKKQNRKDAEVERRAAARKEDAKLSYAVAMAIKRGTPNGEVEEGIEAYEAAKKKYIKFLDKLAIEHLAG